MRGLLAALSVAAVIGLAYWAYRENIRTQQTLDEARALRDEIAALRAAIDVQHAEWAYLNRPDRLRALAEMNFDALGLVPMRPAQFGDVDQVAYPPAPGTIVPRIDGAIDLRAELGPER